MDSKETTILSIALGTWMAWRLIGSSIIPVGRQEIAIAILVLFKPLLDFSGWASLLAINAMSWAPTWYRSWVTSSSFMNDKFLDSMRLSGMVSEGFMTDFSYPPTMATIIISMFLFYNFVCPFIVERAYQKAGIWRRLGR